MSHITQFDNGTALVDVETLTGDSGGAVGPTGGNIDVLGGTGIVTTGNPGTSTLTIATVADGFETVTVQTVGAVTGDLFTFTVGEDESINIFANVVGAVSDYSASLVGTVNGGARRVAAGATALIGSPIASFNEDSGGAPLLDIVVSGNDVIVQVTGVAAETWNWRGLIQFVHQTV